MSTTSAQRPTAIDSPETARAAMISMLRPAVLLGAAGVLVAGIVMFTMGKGSQWLLAQLAAAATLVIVFTPRTLRRLHQLALSAALVAAGVSSLLLTEPSAFSGLLISVGLTSSLLLQGLRGARLAFGCFAIGIAGALLQRGATNPESLALGLASLALLGAQAWLLHSFLRSDQDQRAEIDARSSELGAAMARDASLRLRMATQQLETMGRLSASVAHDVNNALTVIQGSLDVLRDEEDLEERELMADDGCAAVATAVEKLNQLRRFARRGERVARRCNPEEVVQEFHQRIERQLPEGIRLELELGACQEVAIPGPQLEQMLLHLVVNSRDALDGHGRVALTARTLPDGRVRVAVCDDGPGMAPHIARRIFEPFFTTRSDEQGAGLGLALVKKLTEEAGGEIGVHTAPGEGTTIALIFPVIGAAPSEAQRASNRPPGNAMRILLIEDQNEVLTKMQRILASEGHEVHAATTLTSARQLLSQATYDVLCVDGRLPDGMGAELLEEYLPHHPKVAAILATSYGDAQLPPRGVLQLNKPFGRSELLHAIDKLQLAPVE